MELAFGVFFSTYAGHLFRLGVDEGKVRHYEVENRAPTGDATVILPIFVDHLAGLFCLCHPLTDCNRCLFGLVEGNDQLLIVQNVVRGLRNELKDFAFNLLKLALEVTELDNELVFLLFKLWLLIGDNIYQ